MDKADDHQILEYVEIPVSENYEEIWDVVDNEYPTESIDTTDPSPTVSPDNGHNVVQLIDHENDPIGNKAFDTTLIEMRTSDNESYYIQQDNNAVEGDAYSERMGLEEIIMLSISTSLIALTDFNCLKELPVDCRRTFVDFFNLYSPSIVEQLHMDDFYMRSPKGKRIGSVFDTIDEFRNAFKGSQRRKRLNVYIEIKPGRSGVREYPPPIRPRSQVNSVLLLSPSKLNPKNIRDKKNDNDEDIYHTPKIPSCIEQSHEDFKNNMDENVSLMDMDNKSIVFAKSSDLDIISQEWDSRQRYPAGEFNRVFDTPQSITRLSRFDTTISIVKPSKNDSNENDSSDITHTYEPNNNTDIRSKFTITKSYVQEDPAT